MRDVEDVTEDDLTAVEDDDGIDGDDDSVVDEEECVSAAD